MPLAYGQPPDLLAPIPPMRGRLLGPVERGAWTRQIFDDTAPDYDRVERWFSLGTGRWYRRQALARAGLAPGMHVADIGTGTGLVAREALALVGPSGRVVGIDPSENMLRSARESLGIETRVARAERLPLADGDFDFLCMGYALRHLDDLRPAFQEFARVLRPGGRLCILEVTKPGNPLAAGLLRAYMALMCRLACLALNPRPRTGELWRYYSETVDRCVTPECVTNALRAAGFKDADHRLSLGVFSEFTATRQ